MKTLRYAILLTLALAMLAGCAGLPPLVPGAVAPTAAAPAVEEPVATDVTPATEAAPVATEVAPVATEPVAVATPEVAPTVAPVEPPAADNSPLMGVVWEWAALLKTSPATQSVVPDPASYTVVFADGGELLIQADCNNARGTFTTADDAVTITLGPVTSAACPPGSLSNDFLAHLSQVGSFVMDGSDMILRLAESGDSMIFRNGGPTADAAPAPVATEAPAGAPAETPELVGPVWQWENFIDVATGQNTFDIANPAQYTVTFADDGTVAMQADCNRAVGTYTVDGAALNIAVGPVTLALCETDSRSDVFLINLTMAGTHLFADGKLVIDLQADSGRMVFGAAE